MYENGGNVTQRHLDGHPELLVYPFESQLGSSYCVDFLSSLFPFKYRWPEFPIQGNAADDYDLFYDEEMKVRLRSKNSSKFRDASLDLDEGNRKELFVNLMTKNKRTRANLIAAFFISTFESWKNRTASRNEHIYVGYSPIIGVDAEKIFADLPNAHILHIVRNPFSAYAETKKRPFPLSLERYVLTWNLVQHLALIFAEKYPKNFHIVKYEDLISDKKNIMTNICKNVGIAFDESLMYPSWNGKQLDNVYPWGTINTPTIEENLSMKDGLSPAERKKISSYSNLMLNALGYDKIHG